MQSQGLSPEMRLVLACCRWPHKLGQVQAAAGNVDWDRVLVLARRHRVQALVHHALSAADILVPQPAGATLKADAEAVCVQNLRLAAESSRLVRSMENAGTTALVIKGAALAALAYRSIVVKMAWDIDLLVHADAVEGAADVLIAAGYVCTLPGPDRGELAAWHRYSKESVWYHTDLGVHVELHSALVDNPLVLPGVDARSPAQWVEVARGMMLPTLERDALFAYLCVHGAASGWRRAEWLADVAALLGEPDAIEVARLHAAAGALGAGRAASVALLLCERYFAVSLPEELRRTMRRDPVVRLMVILASRMMTAPDGFDDPAETRWGTLPIHLTQMLILPGWRFPLDELRRKLVPDPRLATALSPAQRLLYPLVMVRRRVSGSSVATR